jgi:hypothetical protein
MLANTLKQNACKKSKPKIPTAENFTSFNQFCTLQSMRLNILLPHIVSALE